MGARMAMMGMMMAWQALSAQAALTPAGSDVRTQAPAGASAPVTICMDENPWPPYAFWSTAADGHRELAGFTADVVREALRRQGLQWQIKALPWTAVLASAQGAATGSGCELIWDISYTPERGRYLHYSQPLYRLEYSLLYSREQFPQPPALATAKTLGQRRVCGVDGYNYGYLEQLVTIRRLKSIPAVLGALRQGECELFPVQASVLHDGARKGLYALGERLDCVRLAQVGVSYRVGIAKHSSRAAALVKGLDATIGQLRREGRWDHWRAYYALPDAACSSSVVWGTEPG